MKGSVLILGAAALQVPLISFVKSKGYKTIVVSIPGNYPGFAIADKSIYCDVRDYEKILAAIRNDDIVAVLTDETDISVPTVALLTKKLGLPGNQPDVASTYSNKFAIRNVCKKIGVPVPNYFHTDTLSDLDKKITEITFPAIMKPEDNQGSRGIYVVDGTDEIKTYFEKSKSFSKSGNVIIENMFKGKEFVAEGFVVDGEYINFGIAERKYFNIPGLFIPSQTIFPATISDDNSRKILESEIKLHKELHPNFGMTHSEYILNEETGEYILVETALRGGGVYISSHLVPLYTGIDNYDMLLKCSIGSKVSLKNLYISNSKSSAYICFYLPIGEVVEINGVESLRKMPNVKLADLDNLYVGMKTSPMTNKTMRLGPIILQAKDRVEIEYVIKLVQQTLHIVVKTDDGRLEDIKWE